MTKKALLSILVFLMIGLGSANSVEVTPQNYEFNITGAETHEELLIINNTGNQDYFINMTTNVTSEQGNSKGIYVTHDPKLFTLESGNIRVVKVLIEADKALKPEDYTVTTYATGEKSTSNDNQDSESSSTGSGGGSSGGGGGFGGSFPSDSSDEENDTEQSSDSTNDTSTDDEEEEVVNDSSEENEAPVVNLTDDDTNDTDSSPDSEESLSDRVDWWMILVLLAIIASLGILIWYVYNQEDTEETEEEVE